MALAELAIAQQEGKKGRAGRAYCLSATTANALWEGGASAPSSSLTDRSDIHRPVHAVFLGSDDELKAFAANLQMGREALDLKDRHSKSKSGFSFLKSAGFRHIWQRELEFIKLPDGKEQINNVSILTVYLPELFAFDPGMVDPENVRFVCLPSKAWADAQAGIDHDKVVQYARRLPTVKALNAPPKDERGYRDTRSEHVPKMPDERLRTLVTPACFFAARLDRVTRAPIPPDDRFSLHLLLEALKDGHATFTTDRRGYEYSYDTRPFGENPAHGFKSFGLEEAGYLPPIAYKATQKETETLLARCVEQFFDRAKGA